MSNTSTCFSEPTDNNEKKGKEDSSEQTIESGSYHSVSLPAYSLFTDNDKWLLLPLASLASVFSAIGAPIYYPAITTIESHFHVTQEMVNISIVVYLIAQALSPTIFAGIADAYGRRPVLIVCFIIFIAANISIALVDDYNALLVLRVIQSAGISPTISLANGVVGDLTRKENRAGYVGIVSGLRSTGQAFGSLIGAGLIAGFGWRGIFWFLTIAGGIALLAIILLLPETKRSLVGNGSITPKSILNKAPVLYIPYFAKKWRLNDPDYDTLEERKGIDFTQGIRILAIPELLVIMMNQAFHFTLFSVMLTGLTTQLATQYHYSVVKIGLCYLPCGIGGLTGSIILGRVMDWNYKRRKQEFEDKQKSGVISKGKKFDFIKARLQLGIPINLVSNAFAIAFGWCVNYKVHIATINISTFVVCFTIMGILSIVTTLLVDLYPTKSSGATSASNLTRCGLAAIFIAALSKMIEKMNIGGTMTFIAGLCLLSNVSLLYPILYGMKKAEKINKK